MKRSGTCYRASSQPQNPTAGPILALDLLREVHKLQHAWQIIGYPSCSALLKCWWLRYAGLTAVFSQLHILRVLWLQASSSLVLRPHTPLWDVFWISSSSSSSSVSCSPRIGHLAERASGYMVCFAEISAKTACRYLYG